MIASTFFPKLGPNRDKEVLKSKDYDTKYFGWMGNKREKSSKKTKTPTRKDRHKAPCSPPSFRQSSCGQRMLLFGPLSNLDKNLPPGRHIKDVSLLLYWQAPRKLYSFELSGCE